MESFKEFINPGTFNNTVAAGYGNQSFSPQGRVRDLPTPTLEIPTRQINGRIRSIFYIQNPIVITLENGAVWSLNKSQWDFLKSTGKEIREGKQVSIEMFLDGTIKSISLT